MRCYPDCEDLTDEVLLLAETFDPEDRMAVCLHFLLSTIGRMRAEDVRRMRDDIEKRFGGRYCRSDHCAKMIELIDAHLGSTAPFVVGASPACGANDADRKAERVACDERLPAVGTVVIAYSENTGPHQGRCTAEGSWQDMFGGEVQRVSHWWPLPAADGESGASESLQACA